VGGERVRGKDFITEKSEEDVITTLTSHIILRCLMEIKLSK